MGRYSIILAILATAYVLACLYLYRRQQSLLYQPEPMLNDKQTDLVFVRSGQGLSGWIDNPGQANALVYYGGASESIELRRAELAQHFPTHTRYLVPYRGFGPNAHLSPSESELKADAAALFSAALEHHSCIDIIGRSLGTSMASHVAARLPVHRLVLITPFHSAIAVAQDRYRWFPMRRIVRDWHEIWRDVDRIEIPVLTCLATLDDVTPHKFWEMLRGHFKVEPAIYWDEEDHRLIVEAGRIWPIIVDFLADDPSAQHTPANS